MEGEKVPVLLIVFNRLVTTKLVFNKIRQYQPSRLYVASDGARSHIVGEEQTVDTVRSFVLDNIDWECDVKTLFQSENLGCRQAPLQAISWLFDNEKKGVILEDDCVPSDTFFQYCSFMLKEFEGHSKVKMISGYNRYDSYTNTDPSGFSCVGYSINWGWATWRKTWNEYDIKLSFLKEKNIEDLPGNKIVGKNSIRWWRETIKMLETNNSIWDYQLSLLLLANDYWCAIPNVNQISNIGFGEDSTHTRSSISLDSGYGTGELKFPMKKETQPSFNYKIHKLIMKEHFSNKSLWFQLIISLKTFAGKMLRLFGLKR